MSDFALRALALIGAMTVCYQLEMLSRRVARRALPPSEKGEPS